MGEAKNIYFTCLKSLLKQKPTAANTKGETSFPMTMGSTLETIDAPRTRRNGLLQMINGVFCIIFNAAIFIFMAATRDWLWESQRYGGGIWGGVFYISSGALTFVCAKRQSVCMGIAALTLNVLALILNIVHVISMSVSVMGEDRTNFVDYYWHDDVHD